MTKKASIAIVCSLLVGLVQAQDSARYKHSAVFQQGYDFYSRRVFTQPLLPVEQYAVVAANYNKEQGAFTRRQEAAEQGEISFMTEGTRKIKNYLVSGAFSFSRMQKDSMGYTQRSQPDAAPYYFYAGVKGNWEISSYNLQGVVSRRFAADRLTVSAGAAYKAGNAWRSNDPRTEEFTHDATAEAALHFAISARHTVGIGGGYRMLSEENNNEYRNKDHQDNLLHMPYINVLQYGYGLSVIQTSNRRMDRRGDGINLNALYRGSFGFGTLTAAAEYKDVYSKFYRNATDASSVKHTYGEFNEDIRLLDLLWESKNAGPQSWSVRASYKDHLGKDFNTVLNGNNYVFHEEAATLQPMVAHRKKDCLQYELGLRGGFSRLYRADGTTDHRTDYKNADIGITGAYYFSFRKPATFLKLSVGVNRRQNLDADLSVPSSQETLFTREVVYHDYYFHSADYTDYSGSVLYNMPVKGLPFFLRATVQYRKAGLQDTELPAFSLPGAERWFSAFSLGFTL